MEMMMVMRVGRNKCTVHAHLEHEGEGKRSSSMYCTYTRGSRLDHLLQYTYSKPSTCCAILERVRVRPGGDPPPKTSLPGGALLKEIHKK